MADLLDTIYAGRGEAMAVHVGADLRSRGVAGDRLGSAGDFGVTAVAREGHALDLGEGDGLGGSRLGGVLPQVWRSSYWSFLVEVETSSDANERKEARATIGRALPGCPVRYGVCWVRWEAGLVSHAIPE